MSNTRSAGRSLALGLFVAALAAGCNPVTEPRQQDAIVQETDAIVEEHGTFMPEIPAKQQDEALDRRVFAE